MKKKKQLSRRDAMKMTISMIGGFIGTALGIPSIAYILGPSLKSDQGDWLRVGSLSVIELGTPALFKPRVTRQNGWMVEEEEVGVFVLTDDGRNYHALSNICTHLGCRVRWIAENGQFFSPCHNGVFDKHGFVLSGPPPRPLDEFETKIEDGELYIRLPAVRRLS
ncbi:MAG TPA: ubiquinol-cytochrome c reductase iron-sulfur subunit [Anaerolineales bacterium]|nr:ubiquinol-cytochrome c reductase iron-sulfur subunit [Anaerolineales bacterium]